MSDTRSGEPALLFPGLAGFYAAVSELWYPMIRVAIGALLCVHGWTKFNGGVDGVTAYFVKNGFTPAGGFAYAAIFLETVGAACIVLGLFTRFFAAALAIELFVAFAVIHLPVGFPAGKGGYEYVLFLGIVMFAIALRGGGPYSLDRAIGKEL
jgi:putative oxidoreductase